MYTDSQAITNVRKCIYYDDYSSDLHIFCMSEIKYITYMKKYIHTGVHTNHKYYLILALD